MSKNSVGVYFSTRIWTRFVPLFEKIITGQVVGDVFY